MVLTTHKGALALVAIAALAAGVLLFSITSLASPEEGGPGGQFVVIVDVNVAVDDSNHDKEIEMPAQLTLTIDLTDINTPTTDITISGPPPWVEVSGAIENGQIFASGSGTVADFPNIAVNFQGKLDEDGLSGQYRMGTADDLPGGQHIKYTLKPNAVISTPEPIATATVPALAPPDTPAPSQPTLTPTATPTPTVPGLAPPTDTPGPSQPTLTPTATPTPTQPGVGAPPDTPVLHRTTEMKKRNVDTGLFMEGWEMRVFAGGGCTGSPIASDLTGDFITLFGAGVAFDLPPGDYSVAETQQPGWELAPGTPFCQDFTPGERIIFENRRIRNGDVNGDGVTNSIDVAIVMQTIAGLTSEPPDYVRADVNEDGVINAIDTALMLQFEVGLLDSLPVGQ